MKRFFAWLLAVVAVLSALLGAAPFTPSVFFFAFYLPLAAYVAQGHIRAALTTVFAGGLAWLLTPAWKLPSLAAFVSLAWVVLWWGVVLHRTHHQQRVESWA